MRHIIKAALVILCSRFCCSSELKLCRYIQHMFEIIIVARNPAR